MKNQLIHFGKKKIQLQLSYPESSIETLDRLIKWLTSQVPEERPTFPTIQDDELLYDAIEFKGDELFKSIWYDLVEGGRDKVHIIEFVYKFYEKYDIMPGEFSKVKNSLAYKIFNAIMDPYESYINEEKVDRFINLLQPLEDDPSQFMKRVESLLKRKSFWGYINEQQANEILSQSSHSKTYLIRFSVAKGGKGKLAMSRQEKKKPAVHYRFYYSKLEQMENDLESNGFKTGIKDQSQINVTSPHLLFTEESGESELTNITNLEGVQTLWKKLEDELKEKYKDEPNKLKTFDVILNEMPTEKRKRVKHTTKKKKDTKDDKKGKKDKDKGKSKKKS